MNDRARSSAPDWTPDSWRARPSAQEIAYPSAPELDAAAGRLATLPPLVTSWEIENLREQLAGAQEGRRFVLQGGDCAETLADCRPDAIASKLKILLQMSLVLIHGLKKPVARVGRFAGQYAKPRTSPTETREGRTLPSYFGDLVNRAEFTPEARAPDPRLLLRGYQHAAMTLNFIRALVERGFADFHHPEYWDLSFLRQASLSPTLRDEYERMTRNLADGLEFMEALGERTVGELSGVEFYTSHDGLNLHYESAQTRRVPRREGFYCLTTHFPWIGDRTRALDGPHVEFFRGVRNPVAVKLGPAATPEEVAALCERLNPGDEPGRLTLVTRLGAESVPRSLPRLIDAASGRRVLWMCDPMHGNTVATAGGGGRKTRSFDAILRELEATIETHTAAGSRLGGVHFELTGEDVTECVGGAAGITEAGLSARYDSLCDPRLNYQQALEMAFLLARKLSRAVG
ncbi:MAG: 3-deoxy-7-phosphoheptulonate synthase class II [Phycisphaerales bacterium]